MIFRRIFLLARFLYFFYMYIKVVINNRTMVTIIDLWCSGRDHMSNMYSGHLEGILTRPITRVDFVIMLRPFGFIDPKTLYYMTVQSLGF